MSLRFFPTVVSALLGLIAFPMGSSIARADVRLPSVFSDSMVLQRDQPIRVWGWSDAGETVTLSLAGQSATADPDATGRWEATLPPMKANSQPQTLTVAGNNTIEVADILIGEVWLCSGQSNMGWTVQSSVNAQQEISSANFPNIRHIKIPLVFAMTPQTEVDAQWQVCSPETVGRFTACGYFMGRQLHQELGVPIGLINSSWGGTRVDPWIPLTGYARSKTLRGVQTSVLGRTPGTPPYRESLSNHINDLKAWITEADTARQNGTAVPPSPEFPASMVPFQDRQDPTVLYNAMIHPIVGFPIRGAIWYQGESNHFEGMRYLEKKKALIGGWRELWKQGDFPFHYVQIAPFQYGEEDPKILPRFWEAQAAVEEQVANTAMVVINDVATLDDIHPPNKQAVGRRLAALALRRQYGRDELSAESPKLKSLDVIDGALKLTFQSSGGGLVTRDGKPPTYFEIIDAESGGFQPATATIEGNTVVLKSDSVAQPTAFRFAWHKLAQPNLMGKNGLPVGAVRGGEVPSFVDTLPLKDYQLVYDLDLAKLGRNIRYDVDRSDDVESISRVGYLVELGSAGGPVEAVFVSMDAFTDDPKQIGIPTAASKAVFQRRVTNMDVSTNSNRVTSGIGLKTGNLEFWPHNYGKSNASNVPGASSQVYDFGDQFSPPVNGYGSMQIHNFGAKETVFAINHWNVARNADLGIGNSDGESRDWTFQGNAATYSQKRLRVFIKP